MKKNNTAKKSPKPKALSNSKKNQIREVAAKQRLTIGLDLGDRTSRYCILGEAGEVVSESQLPTTKAGLSSLFEKMPSSRIALEVGTHSPWPPLTSRRSSVMAYARCGMIFLENKNAGAYWKRWVVFLPLERSAGLRIH
jgi:hypothetical protein